MWRRFWFLFIIHSFINYSEEGENDKDGYYYLDNDFSKINDCFARMKSTIEGLVRKKNVSGYLESMGNVIPRQDIESVKRIEGNLISAIDFLNPFYDFDDEKVDVEEMLGLQGWSFCKAASNFSHNFRIGELIKQRDGKLKFVLAPETLVAMLSSRFYRFYETIKLYLLKSQKQVILDFISDCLVKEIHIPEESLEKFTEFLEEFIFNPLKVSIGVMANQLAMTKFVRAKDYIDYHLGRVTDLLADNMVDRGDPFSRISKAFVFEEFILPVKGKIYQIINGSLDDDDPLERIMLTLEFYLLSFTSIGGRSKILSLTESQMQQKIIAQRLLSLPLKFKKQFEEKFPIEAASHFFDNINMNTNININMNYSLEDDELLLEFEIGLLTRKFVQAFDNYIAVSMGNLTLDQQSSAFARLLPMLIRDWQAYRLQHWFESKSKTLANRLSMLKKCKSPLTLTQTQTIRITNQLFHLSINDNNNATTTHNVIKLILERQERKKIAKKIVKFRKKNLDFWDTVESLCSSCLLKVYGLDGKKEASKKSK